MSNVKCHECVSPIYLYFKAIASLMENYWKSIRLMIWHFIDDTKSKPIIGRRLFPFTKREQITVIMPVQWTLGKRCCGCGDLMLLNWLSNQPRLWHVMTGPLKKRRVQVSSVMWLLKVKFGYFPHFGFDLSLLRVISMLNGRWRRRYMYEIQLWNRLQPPFDDIGNLIWIP